MVFKDGSGGEGFFDVGGMVGNICVCGGLFFRIVKFVWRVGGRVCFLGWS